MASATYIKYRSRPLKKRFEGVPLESPGCYRITHVRSGLYSIGSTMNLKKALQRHLKKLTQSNKRFYTTRRPRTAIWDVRPILVCSSEDVNYYHRGLIELNNSKELFVMLTITDKFPLKILSDLGFIKKKRNG